MGNERNFHNAVYVLLTLLGLRVDTEVRTSDGRIDLTVKTDKYIYIIELKYNGTAAEALKQIVDNRSAIPFSSDSRRKILIGASFSSDKRCIDEWNVIYP